MVSVTDLRQHAIDALPLKLFSEGKYEGMDGYQWLLAVAAHIERHTKQMLEVKADPNFPSVNFVGQALASLWPAH